jgi:hypothetical protein
MNNTERLEVYQAQCVNVKAISTAFKQTKRVINDCLRKNRVVEAESHTKVLALTFCAWSEANFSKTIHTPHGFTLDEIAQIKRFSNTNGISEGWKKCIELAMRKSAAKKSNFTPNARQKLERLVAELVLEPSTLRNKIAHGQWRVPLNRANTSVNEKLEADLSKLDVVTVDTWKVRQHKLCELVELLIESPNKAFIATYWNLIEEIQDIGVKRKDWNAESKQTRLKA